LAFHFGYSIYKSDSGFRRSQDAWYLCHGGAESNWAILFRTPDLAKRSVVCTDETTADKNAFIYEGNLLQRPERPFQGLLNSFGERRLLWVLTLLLIVSEFHAGETPSFDQAPVNSSIGQGYM